MKEEKQEATERDAVNQNETSKADPKHDDFLRGFNEETNKPKFDENDPFIIGFHQGMTGDIKFSKGTRK